VWKGKTSEVEDWNSDELEYTPKTNEENDAPESFTVTEGGKWSQTLPTGKLSSSWGEWKAKIIQQRIQIRIGDVEHHVKHIDSLIYKAFILCFFFCYRIC
jgi:hypothetical protein